MRLSDEATAVLIAHEARMKRLLGSPVTRSQCVEGLLALGAAAWDASEKTRFWSPGAVIERGEHELVKERLAIEARNASDSLQRKQDQEEARRAPAKKGS
jgi:hypothetical protein